MKKISILGPEGSFSYILALKIKERLNSEIILSDNFNDIISSIGDNYGLLPIENSTTSNVHENIDSLFNSRLYILGEAFLSIKLNLIGLKNSKLTDIDKVYSHPKALSQASKFLIEKNLKTEFVSSTSKGQEIVLCENIKNIAAIGSSHLIDKENLKILESNIQNNKINKTRFLIVSKQEDLSEKQGSLKASIIFKLSHQPGSLVRILNYFSENNLNLTKIESRPIPNTEWEYSFWVDFILDSRKIKKVLDEMKDKVVSMQLLGVYPNLGTFDS